MGVDQAIDITAAERKIILELLDRYLPGTPAWVYGSRVKWTSRPKSDLDLVVFATPQQQRQVGDLREAFEESNLPFRVDLFVWDEAPESFREQIETEHVVLVDTHRHHIAGNSVHRRLEDCMTAIIDYRGRTPRKVSSGIPLITAKIVKGGRIMTPTEFIAAEDYDPWMRRGIPQSGDVVVTTEAPLGEVAQLNHQRVALAQRLILLRGKSRVLDNRFLKYLMQSEGVQDQLYGLATGTTVTGIKQGELRQIELALPPIFEQEAIAHILGTLDDKIELNRRMNATLEATARALFRSWFVDFHPVRAKMESRDTGLPKDIADLFPDQMVDSELGRIPEGWPVGTLGDIAGSPRRAIDPAQVDAETPYIGLEHMPRLAVALTDWGRTGSVSSNKFTFEEGDILFGKLRPYFHKVGIAPVSGVCSTDIVVLRAKRPQMSAFVLFCASSATFVTYTTQTSTGTKMPRTSWQTMSKYELCQPTDPAAHAFDHVVRPILERIVANVQESVTLGVLRDTLLPKLVSGELRMHLVDRPYEERSDG